MEFERCCDCDEPTGRAERAADSLYTLGGSGPFCSDCWDDKHAIVDTVRRKLADRDRELKDIALLVFPTDEAFQQPPVSAVIEEITRLRKDAERLALVERWSNEQIAEMFHRNYERLAPSYSYKTREASAVPWKDVPESNQCLMISTVGAVLQEMTAKDAAPPEEEGQADDAERWQYFREHHKEFMFDEECGDFCFTASPCWEETLDQAIDAARGKKP